LSTPDLDAGRAIARHLVDTEHGNFGAQPTPV
jgi:hypothetical protein